MGTPLNAQPRVPDAAPAERNSGGGSRKDRVPVPRIAAGALVALGFLGYPLLIYFAHTHLAARGLGALILALYGLPMLLLLRRRPVRVSRLLRRLLPLFALVGAASVLDDRRLLLFLPTLVSASLSAGFAWSLHRGPPLIERFARLVEDDLPPFTLSYCRHVTRAWSVFLALHALVAALLAVAAPLAWWVAYTGPVFSALLGLGLGGEACFRKVWFRYYGDGPIDRQLGRWFPPGQTARGRRSLAYVESRRSAGASPQ